jgi:hypothetical protein
MKALEKLTALSTVNLTLKETEDYLAPSAPKTVDPSFEERAGGTWAASIGLVRSMLEWVGIAVVAAVPWSPVALLASAGYWIYRRRTRLVRA